jgi:hypothetical protein
MLRSICFEDLSISPMSLSVGFNLSAWWFGRCRIRKGHGVRARWVGGCTFGAIPNAIMAITVAAGAVGSCTAAVATVPSEE